MRRAEADEGRHEEDAAGVRHGRGERSGFACVRDDAEAVAQPLQRGPGGEDRAFERVAQPSTSPPRDGREDARPGGDAAATCVHEHERARAVGVLGHSVGRARLAEKRGLLVAGDPRDGGPNTKRGRVRH